MPEIPDFINELKWRGFLKDCTDEDGLRRHLQSGTRLGYAGFDPTANSLTIGNLMPIMLLKHWQRAGHKPVVVMGGGTGLIGDPSGKSAERQLNTPETVAANVRAQRPIFESVLGRSSDDPASTQPVILNNLDWLGGISYIEALRDIGKHFSVNMMMQKESVKARLTNREQGISYTEFSYMILQAYDFLHLYRKHGVTTQIGGSDQFGNIVAGGDLIRRVGVNSLIELQVTKQMSEANDFEHEGRRLQLTHDSRVNLQKKYEHMRSSFLRAGGWVSCPFGSSGEIFPALDDWATENVRGRTSWSSFGLTCPLVTKADGTKFGKTESGAVWLTADRTSPFAYYQFWLNTADADVGRFLRFFTLLPKNEIEDLEAQQRENPGQRPAQRRLAKEATELLHGDEAYKQAAEAAKALFSGDIAGLRESLLREVFAEVPSSDHPKRELEGEGFDPVALLVQTGLAQSNRQAREFLSAGSVSVNGRKITLDHRLTRDDLLHGSLIAIRRGKKNWHLTRWG